MQKAYILCEQYRCRHLLDHSVLEEGVELIRNWNKYVIKFANMHNSNAFTSLHGFWSTECSGELRLEMQFMPSVHKFYNVQCASEWIRHYGSRQHGNFGFFGNLNERTSKTHTRNFNWNNYCTFIVKYTTFPLAKWWNTRLSVATGTLSASTMKWKKNKKDRYSYNFAIGRRDTGFMWGDKETFHSLVASAQCVCSWLLAIPSSLTHVCNGKVF